MHAKIPEYLNAKKPLKLMNVCIHGIYSNQNLENFLMLFSFVAKWFPVNAEVKIYTEILVIQVQYIQS